MTGEEGEEEGKKGSDESLRTIGMPIDDESRMSIVILAFESSTVATNDE